MSISKAPIQQLGPKNFYWDPKQTKTDANIVTGLLCRRTKEFNCQTKQTRASLKFKQQEFLLNNTNEAETQAPLNISPPTYKEN
jgi:hypothetical protein